MDDAELARITWRGMAAFQRLVGRHGPQASLVEGDGFVASLVPDAESSLVNAAVPIEGAPLAARLDEIASFYAPARKWGAWIEPDASADAAALRDRGLVLDSTPVLMAVPLDEAAATRAGLDVVVPTPSQVGAVNDAAYGTPHGHLAHMTSTFPPDALRCYGAHAGGELACVLMILDAGDDAFVTLVATLPQHRGKRLASTLLAHALHEAKQRGQTTTSLQASKLGQGIYARLGYRPLGEVHLYERRLPA